MHGHTAPAVHRVGVGRRSADSWFFHARATCGKPDIRSFAMAAPFPGPDLIKTSTDSARLSKKSELSVRLGESRNQLRGLKVGGEAMCGAVPCPSAGLTTHAVQTLNSAGLENAKACAPRRATRCGDERGKRGRCARIRTMSDGTETSHRSEAPKPHGRC